MTPASFAGPDFRSPPGPTCTWVTDEIDPLALQPLLEGERAGANRMISVAGAVLADRSWRRDAERLRRHFVLERRVRLLEADLHLVLVDHLRGVVGAKVAQRRAGLVVLVHDPVEVELDCLRVERRAILERHALAERERIDARILRDRHLRRKSRSELSADLVHQRVEDRLEHLVRADQRRGGRVERVRLLEDRDRDRTVRACTVRRAKRRGHTDHCDSRCHSNDAGGCSLATRRRVCCRRGAADAAPNTRAGHMSGLLRMALV